MFSEATATQLCPGLEELLVELSFYREGMLLYQVPALYQLRTNFVPALYQLCTSSVPAPNQLRTSSSVPVPLYQFLCTSFSVQCAVLALHWRSVNSI